MSCTLHNSVDLFGYLSIMEELVEECEAKRSTRVTAHHHCHQRSQITPPPPLSQIHILSFLSAQQLTLDAVINVGDEAHLSARGTPTETQTQDSHGAEALSRAPNKKRVKEKPFATLTTASGSIPTYTSFLDALAEELNKGDFDAAFLQDLAKLPEQERSRHRVEVHMQGRFEI
ncbi:hypothetical protein Fmac_016158 [Flemingia macrophylla]|uniref:Uncharacterized protein n=1 Tax=Flemingia macrophylla TaxID=520843 RepID=A0ABD1MGM4_9FABA